MLLIVFPLHNLPFLTNMLEYILFEKNNRCFWIIFSCIDYIHLVLPAVFLLSRKSFLFALHWDLHKTDYPDKDYQQTIGGAYWRWLKLYSNRSEMGWNGLFDNALATLEGNLDSMKKHGVANRPAFIPPILPKVPFFPSNLHNYKMSCSSSLSKGVHSSFGKEVYPIPIRCLALWLSCCLSKTIIILRTND